MDYLVNPKLNANFLIIERHTEGIDNTGEGDRSTSQEYWPSPEARRGRGPVFPYSLCREGGPANALISDF